MSFPTMNFRSADSRAACALGCERVLLDFDDGVVCGAAKLADEGHRVAIRVDTEHLREPAVFEGKLEEETSDSDG